MSDDARREKLLRAAKKNHMLAREATQEARREALKDREFAYVPGKQWPDQIRAQRSAEERPCLTVNRQPQFIKQVANDMRQNRPAIKVSPVDDGADVETARILQGLIRHIEYDSNADVAYDTAGEHAVGHGFGFIRIATEFCSPESFDQDIKIRRKRNPFLIYMDPSCQEPDYSDALWGFDCEWFTEEDYKAQWPDSELAGEDWSGIGARAPDWFQDGGCLVSEYFYVVEEPATLYLLSDRSTTFDPPPEGSEVFVVTQRQSVRRKVKWARLNGVEVLEENDWAGYWIPIVPVLGEEVDVDGKVHLYGIVRHARDPQSMLNFWVSSETETIALAPRAPFIAEASQIQEYKKYWETANKKNWSYLPYKATSIDGTPVPPPMRNVYEAPVAAITNARMRAADDLKAVVGIYDDALGANQNEKSGKAILARQRQSNNATFHFVDNLSRAIRHIGRIIVDLIPKIYDTRRVIRIIGEDGTDELVGINGALAKDQKDTYAFGAGKFDVVVSSGPSYATKRQEAAQSMLDLAQAYPPLMQIAGDLLVKNLDWPGADEIADRVRKTLPENLRDDQQGDVPPQIRAQMAQAQQMIDQLTQALNEANGKLEARREDLESRERIAAMQARTQLIIAFEKLDASDALRMFDSEIARLMRIEDREAAQDAAEREPAEMAV